MQWLLFVVEGVHFRPGISSFTKLGIHFYQEILYFLCVVESILTRLE